MRRYVNFIFLILFMLVLTSCSRGRNIDTSAEIKPEFIDGEYTVSSAYYDSFGYKSTLVLGIHSGILTDVDFIEKNKAGENRDELHESLVPWEKCQYSYLQIKPILYEDTILTQGSKIDAISGATKTCDDYRILLKEGLDLAKTGGPSEKIIDSFSDVYVLTSEVDPLTGSQEELRAEFSDGELNSITVRELSTATTPRLLAGVYSALAENSTRLKSLEDVVDPTVDVNILNRYNAMLSSLRAMRGEE